MLPMEYDVITKIEF